MQFWESLIYNTQSPTKTTLSLTLHHIIGSREATDLLHKFDMGISYTDVRLLTNTQAKGITKNRKMILKKQFSNKESVHISFGKCNGKQPILSGYYITHPTTGTIIQPNNVSNNDKAFYLEEFDFSNGVEEGEINYGEYKFS